MGPRKNAAMPEQSREGREVRWRKTAKLCIGYPRRALPTWWSIFSCLQKNPHAISHRSRRIVVQRKDDSLVAAVYVKLVCLHSTTASSVPQVTFSLKELNLVSSGRLNVEVLLTETIGTFHYSLRFEPACRLAKIACLASMRDFGKQNSSNKCCYPTKN